MVVTKKYFFYTNCLLDSLAMNTEILIGVTIQKLELYTLTTYIGE